MRVGNGSWFSWGGFYPAFSAIPKALHRAASPGKPNSFLLRRVGVCKIKKRLEARQRPGVSELQELDLRGLRLEPFRQSRQGRAILLWVAAGETFCREQRA